DTRGKSGRGPAGFLRSSNVSGFDSCESSLFVGEERNMSRYSLVLVISVILGGHLVSAQVTTGTISGVVQDSSGAVTPGVSVTVTGEAPLVEATTPAMSSLVDARTIRELPLNGRSYDQLALLQPGVVTVGAGQASAAFDFGTGTRFSVTGSRAYANSFMLDGTDINDHANGTPGGSAGTNLGVDGVQEVKINTAVSPAEYGRSSGGVISAVTRSGTNELHGTGFEFLRNNALDSLGYFDQ